MQNNHQRNLTKLKGQDDSRQGKSRGTACTAVDSLTSWAHGQEVKHAGLSREACCIICKYVPMLL
jgi:hypothetical protein